MKVAVIGAGTWGTALAIVLANNSHEVTLWSKFESEICDIIESHKHKNLPGATIPDTIIGTDDLEKAMKDKELIVLAVPSIYVRGTARDMFKYVSGNESIVTVAKGIEEGTLCTMTDIVSEEMPCVRVAVLSGPTHAEEVSRQIPTTIVAGAEDSDTAKTVQDAFMNENFRVYTNLDMNGIEIGAALKNVIALAAGMADGLGYGDNTKAALITRGIAEISRLGIAMGSKPETFSGLSGMGDLIVTCASMHSRNRRAGILIGQGKNYEEAMKEVGQVVEGVYAAKAALELSRKYDVDMPIVEKVNEVLFGDKPVREAVSDLMLRDKKLEN